MIVPERVTAVITHVTDGDTLEVRTEEGDLTVRLAGINTPEEGECHAGSAVDHLLGTLEGVEVTLDLIGFDQFGRSLAYVLDESMNINLEMVTLGLALATTPGEEDPLGPALIDAEQAAFDARVGLWALDACGRDRSLPRLTFDIAASQPDPLGPDEQALAEEIVVIVNTGSETVDLSGWIVRDESSRHRFVFAAGTSLSAGESLAITSADDGWTPGASPVWNNGGDLALLQDANGTVVARWRY